MIFDTILTPAGDEDNFFDAGIDRFLDYVSNRWKTSTIGNSSLGTVLVAGKNRVPSPATGITAFRTLMDLRASALDNAFGLPFGSFLTGFALDAKRGDGPGF